MSSERDEWDEPADADLGLSTLRGRLLVASPVLTDPNFDRTVVLLVEHGADGALGLVLNRPSELPLGEVLERWAPRAAAPGAMFLGGPVQPSAVICLAAGDLPGHDDPVLTSTAVPGISLVDLDGDPDVVHPGIEVRCFAGYAGWGGGQLEAEIDEGSWFVVDPFPADPFVRRPSRLWRDVLARQPGPLARYALYPSNPMVN